MASRVERLRACGSTLGKNELHATKRKVGSVTCVTARPEVVIEALGPIGRLVPRGLHCCALGNRPLHHVTWVIHRRLHME